MGKLAFAKIKDIAENLIPSDSKAVAVPADQNQPTWMGQVAVLTGLLAALAGYLTVRTNLFTNDSIYESNQAVLSQARASDAWAEYQANSIKARIVETQLLAPGLTAPNKQELNKQDDELRTRQPTNKQDAENNETQRNEHLANSLKRREQKDLLEYAGMAAQLGIALASVAALTRRREVFYIGIGAGAISVFITAYAMIESFLE